MIKTVPSMPLIIAECQRHCVVTSTEDDLARSSRGGKGNGRMEGGRFGKEEKGEFSSGNRRGGNGRQEGQEWGSVRTQGGKVVRGRRRRPRKDICQQALNIGTCESSVTR